MLRMASSPLRNHPERAAIVVGDAQRLDAVDAEARDLHAGFRVDARGPRHLAAPSPPAAPRARE